jgi:thiamine kinase-like enzyme
MHRYGLSIPPAQIVENTVRAGRSGVGARVLASRVDPPALLLEFLDGRMLEQADIARPENIGRIARAMRRLHHDTPAFPNEVSTWGLTQTYFGLVDEHGLRLPAATLDVRAEVERVEEALRAVPGALVPSQVDTYAWNLLDVAGDIRIIDYDFAGMADEYLDLGDVAMEGDLDPDATAVLVDHYFGGHDDWQLARTLLFGISAQYMWSMLFVGMAQLIPDLPAGDFDYWGEAELRLGWVVKRLDSLPVSTLVEQASQA